MPAVRFIVLLTVAAGLSLAACSGGSQPAPLPSSVLASAPQPLSGVSVGSGVQALFPSPTTAEQFTPDEHITYQRQASGTYTVWMAAGGTYGTYRFTSPDLLTFGSPTTVFTPAGPGTTAFDADYVGPGSVFPAVNGTDLLMVYHAENHLFSGVDYAASPFYAGIGLARSSDGGVTWQREGEIISGHDPQQATQTAAGAGASTPSVVASGGYLYVVYRETDVQSNVSGFAVARAPVSSDGAPGSWQKYDNGSFSTPGLGGAFSPLAITLDPSAPGDERQPEVSYNTALHQFVMIAVGNGGLYVLTSPELVTWSSATLALPAPAPDAAAGTSQGPRNWYPALISPAETSEETTDQTGYVYYAAFAAGSSRHTGERQSFTLNVAP